MQRSLLASYRRRYGLNQKDAARQMGISYQTLASIERGHRMGSWQIWRIMQKFYGIPNSQMWSCIQGDGDYCNGKLVPYDKELLIEKWKK